MYMYTCTHNELRVCTLYHVQIQSQVHRSVFVDSDTIADPRPDMILITFANMFRGGYITL